MKARSSRLRPAPRNHVSNSMSDRRLRMLATDLSYLHQAPFAPLWPAALIMLTVGALNLVADAIRGEGPTARPSTRSKERAHADAS